jgi:hypothetical protein
MTRYVLYDDNYTFDASAKTITLIDSYATLSLSQIIKITNITTKAVIYDSALIRNSISLTSGVISFDYDESGMADTDDLQIVIDTSNAGALVLTNVDGEDSTKPGMYYIDMAGAGDAEFILPVDSVTREIINVEYVVDSAVTLTPYFQGKALGTSNWCNVTAYTYGTYAGDGTSQDLNTAHPLRHILAANNEYRYVLNVGGACKVGLQVMAVEL